MKHITSRQNPLVASYRSMATGADRAHLLLDGIHLVSDALDAGLRMTDAVVASSAVEDTEVATLMARLVASGVDVSTAAPAVMAALSPVRSPSPIVASAARDAQRPADVFGRQPALLVCVVDVQDPGNVGAIVRVGEAGGATGIAVTGQSADPFGWKALRGSMGSALRLPIRYPCDATTFIADARAHGCRIAAAVPRGGVRPEDSELCGPTVVLVGGEGPGLTTNLIADADIRLTIPMERPVESLNTATCAALLVYEARRQRHAVATVARSAGQAR